MKRIVTLLLFALPPLCATAQNDDKAIALGEVVVQGAKVVNRIDGQTIYPSDAQKESSSNGYGLLQKLALPQIKIDIAAHSISAADNKGEVQIRINGIIADSQKMLALDPKTIARISFVNNPGVRYGDGIAYVIDIITRRADNGGTTALQASYQLGNWQLTLTWMSPLTQRYKQYESEILNRYLHKHATGYDKDNSNRLMLNIAWRINRGKKRQSAEKTINLKDTDNGIIK